MTCWTATQRAVWTASAAATSSAVSTGTATLPASTASYSVRKTHNSKYSYRSRALSQAPWRPSLKSSQKRNHLGKEEEEEEEEEEEGEEEGEGEGGGKSALDRGVR